MNTPASITLTRASDADADYFAAMEQEPDTREYIIPYTALDHREKIRDSSLVYLKIEERGSTVGFIILRLEPDGRSVEFRRIVVSEKGRGIGQAALISMEEFCLTRLGRSRIWLDVFEHNLRGQHVYQKLGYRRLEDQRAEHEGKTLLFYDKLISTGGA